MAEAVEVSRTRDGWRIPGAALKIVADDETGELESATILGQWGEVPGDFAEQLRGG